MRHIRSILYAFVLAPAVWVLVGVGLTHDLTARGRDGFAVESLTGLLLLVLGGAAYGILIFAPISPAGPFLAGLGFLGVGVWAIEAPADYARMWPAAVTKPGFDLSRPGYGLVALLAVPMIVTVLSARRWAKYEPPVLPIIGQIGRARGAAPAPGTPIGVAETTVIGGRPFIGGFATETERTTVLRMPAQNGNTTAVVVTAPEEPTAVVVASAPEEPTAVVVAFGGDEPTAAVAQPAGEEKTLASVAKPASEEKTLAWAVKPADEEATVASAVKPADEEDTLASAAKPAEEEKTLASAAEPAGEEPTEAVLGEKTQTAADDDAASGDETAVAVAGAPGEDETGAADETTRLVTPANGARPAPEQPKAAENAASGDGERTQVLRLPTGPARPDDGAEKTQAIRLPMNAEPTQLLKVPAAENGEKTQVLRMPTDAPGQPAKVSGEPAPRVAGGDETQVIRMPDGPAKPPSIAGAERPNFAEDPTGRLVPPGPVSDEPTRTMTVMNLERPPEEIPAQRRPTPDED